jgi:hypothetical protein
MIKKLALLLAFAIVLPAVAYAADDIEMLLIDDGTLYTVERAWPRDYPNVYARSNSFLILSERRGDSITRYLVPGTLEAGVHTNPALAYDNDSKTLFLFWQYSQSAMHSELYFSAFSNGNWSPQLTFGTSHNARSNLRIAVTRKVTVQGPNGQYLQPEVNVHAVWWEFDSPTGREMARYALLSIENGQVLPPTETYTLSSFAEQTAKQQTDAAFNPDILKHPALFATTPDTVDVVFGDTDTNAFHRVTLRPLKPELNARIRIPVGVKDTPLTGAPRFRETSTADRISALTGDGNSVVFYLRNEKAVDYVMYKNGSWAAPKSIALDEQVSSEGAVLAIRRMLNEQ